MGYGTFLYQQVFITYSKFTKNKRLKSGSLESYLNKIVIKLKFDLLLK